MLKSILIGLDGSPYSHTAVDLAMGWARRSPCVLAGLGIIDEPHVRAPEPVPLGGSWYKERRDEVRMAQATQQVEAMLADFSRRCAEAGVTSRILEKVGSPAEQILLESQRFDLILLGRQTYFQFATDEGPDATLTEILRATPRPVVTVPRTPPTGSTALVAYDGSLQAARALQVFEATGLARLYPVHVLSVGPDAVVAGYHAERACDFLRSHEANVTPQVVTSPAAPGEVILEQIRSLNAALLVMGAYGKSVIRDFFFGSATRTLLSESPVPLFVYH